MSGRRNTTAADEGLLGLMAVIGLIVVIFAMWVSMSLAHHFNGGPAVNSNPVGAALDVPLGNYRWGNAATWWLAAVVAAIAVPAGTVTVLWMRADGRRKPIDRAAANLSVDRDGIKRYLGEHQVPGLYADGPAPSVGYLVRGGRRTKRLVQLSWEDVAVVFGGPRVGKTMSQVIPAIASAPGACVATSNKADVYQQTAGLRADTGRVWLFDPQQIADPKAPDWWWNPLTGVCNVGDAERLGNIWVDVTRQPGAREDAYFDPAGRALLNAHILAAAVGGVGLDQVARWLKDPSIRAPFTMLERSAYPAVADTIAAAQALPDKQQAGVYGTAVKAVGWLDNPMIARWVIDTGDARPAFDPDAYVRSTDTVYLLSREGTGSAAPLVTAFTATLLAAAETYAQECGGRLPVPLLAVLDEAANVCRWRELPDLYSHYGSRSITLLTILQSWAQGVEVWGEQGMEKLWGAANVRVYLGGIADPKFLGRVSDLCGEWEAPSTSTSTSPGHRSRTRATRRDRVFPVSLLGSLPAGRAVVLLSATDPVLVRTMPWTKGPHADQIRSALNQHTTVIEAPVVDPGDDPELAPVVALADRASPDAEPVTRRSQA